MITIDKMEFLHFTKLVHDVPAEVFTHSKLIQIYVFRSKTMEKKSWIKKGFYLPEY